ncbi:phosphodiesterase [Thaumasiovibrio subtropicus]|uniref:phosphodiesterase n=1 Tax=Thaumasiovibrio subtropicus TaxID=1891207 RepID=UPI000B35BD40|nr:phosphodiesterase [Thaumasiovibrio subtropicus]
MKLFFASDIHGNVLAAQRVVDAYQASGADYLVLLGDILNFGPRNPIIEGLDPQGVVALLNPLAEKIIAVRGNCDSEVDQALLHFPLMMDYNWVLLPNGRRLFLTHGHIYHPGNLPPLGKGDVVAYGHTHLPVAEWQGEHVFFNPGSVTYPRGDHKASYGLFEHNRLSVLDFEGNVLAATDI